MYAADIAPPRRYYIYIMIWLDRLETQDIYTHELVRISSSGILVQLAECIKPFLSNTVNRLVSSESYGEGYMAIYPSFGFHHNGMYVVA